MEEVLAKLSQIERLINSDILLKKPLLTLDESADLAGVSRSTIYKWLSSRKLTHYKPSGKLVFIKKEDLYDFITRKKYSNKEELVKDTQTQMSKQSQLKITNATIK